MSHRTRSEIGIPVRADKALKSAFSRSDRRTTTFLLRRVPSVFRGPPLRLPDWPGLNIGVSPFEFARSIYLVSLNLRRGCANVANVAALLVAGGPK